jgi:hypothetical protein
MTISGKIRPLPTLQNAPRSAYFVCMNRPSVHKRTHQRVVRTTITMPPVLWDRVQEFIRQDGYIGLSDFVQAAIRARAGAGIEAHHMAPHRQ